MSKQHSIFNLVTSITTVATETVCGLGEITSDLVKAGKSASTVIRLNARKMELEAINDNINYLTDSGLNKDKIKEIRSKFGDLFDE